jgi:hypothetical protein
MTDEPNRKLIEPKRAWGAGEAAADGHHRRSRTRSTAASRRRGGRCSASLPRSLCTHPGVSAQMINFWKNITMAGGFLYVLAYGAGAYSLNAWLAKRRHMPHPA